MTARQWDNEVNDPLRLASLLNQISDSKTTSPIDFEGITLNYGGWPVSRLEGYNLVSSYHYVPAPDHNPSALRMCYIGVHGKRWQECNSSLSGAKLAIDVRNTSTNFYPPAPQPAPSIASYHPGTQLLGSGDTTFDQPHNLFLDPASLTAGDPLVFPNSLSSNPCLPIGHDSSLSFMNPFQTFPVGVTGTGMAGGSSDGLGALETPIGHQMTGQSTGFTDTSPPHQRHIGTSQAKKKQIGRELLEAKLKQALKRSKMFEKQKADLSTSLNICHKDCGVMAEALKQQIDIIREYKAHNAQLLASNPQATGIKTEDGLVGIGDSNSGGEDDSGSDSDEESQNYSPEH